MPAHNALASRVVIDQLTPLLPNDNEEVNAQIKHLHGMLDAATMTDPTLDHGDRRRGQDPDHCQSPHEDSARCVVYAAIVFHLYHLGF
jgi:hypothetical protein